MFSRPAFIRTEQSTIRRKPFDGSRRRWKPPGIQVANKSSVVGETGLGYHSAGSGEAPSRRTNPGCCADLAGDRTCRHWIAICRDADRSVANFYITEHFSLSLIALLLCTGCNETERFFSRVSRSRNRVSTLWFVLAEVSRKPQPQLAASAAPSLIDTSRTDGLSSHLFPTNIMGICEISWPLSSLITAQIGRSSSRLCREHTEYTKMKAWPLLMESRCIAGNWWDPVVSVIWSVHMFLSQLITCL